MEGKMEKYKNLNGNSRIEFYDIGDFHIDIKYQGDNNIYKFLEEELGSNTLTEMKNLAKQGKGLNTYLLEKDLVNKFSYKTIISVYKL